jgi:hypothetical protein
MDACNRHGESIVHISCRRGQADTLRFLLRNGGRVHMCDDLGRTPLHDACWAKAPVFDCISTIMDRDPSLIRVVDCRGASPLAYIRREHWPVWRHFFDSKKDTYWKPREPNATASSSSSSSSSSASSVASSASSASLSGDEAASLAIDAGIHRQLSFPGHATSAATTNSAASSLSSGGGGGGMGQEQEEESEAGQQLRAKRVRSSTRLAAEAAEALSSATI